MLTTPSVEPLFGRLTGVYHLAGATRVSEYEFARLIAETLGLDRELVRPAATGELGWTAPRPRDSSLDVGKAVRVLRNRPNDILTALGRLKEEYASRRAA